MPLKKGQPPQCKRCGRDHWPFVACEKLDGWRENSEKLREGRQPYWVQQPREGFTDWGDRMGNYVNLGGNLVLDRPIKQGGNVRVPDDWGFRDEGDEA